MQNFLVQEKIEILEKQTDRQKMQRLVYEWVKIGHISCKEYLDLCDWICEHTSLNERCENDDE